MVAPKTQDLPKKAKSLLNKPNVSDGSELVPAEVQASSDREGYTNVGQFPPSTPTENLDQAAEESGTTQGYTIDQEGLINNYAVTPDIEVQTQSPFGWTEKAERLNGRFAMVGFALLVLNEVLAGDSLVSILSGSAIPQ
ncbi:MAG: hypothetical protein VKJ85_13455 [Prochlorothrix sp.]|nr:hypothetical protein [Prochlorothrix sp.]